MLRVSASSVRLTNPEAHIEVVCDQYSDAASRAAVDPLRDEVDRWTVQPTPPGDPRYRSRYLKTSLRRHLRGPFLYLDADTLVRGDLSEIFQLDVDFAAAPNHSADAFPDQIWEQDKDTCDQMGWEVGASPYVNGGVVFFADTPDAERLGAAWHDKWLSCAGTVGRDSDQPALNAALSEVRPQVRILPHRYNAQFRTNLEVSVGAVILHYYATDPGVKPAALALAERIQAGAPLRVSEVEDMLRRDHPWMRKNALDDWMARRASRKRALDEVYTLWLGGHRTSALVAWLGQRVRGWSHLPSLNKGAMSR